AEGGRGLGRFPVPRPPRRGVPRHHRLPFSPRVCDYGERPGVARGDALEGSGDETGVSAMRRLIWVLVGLPALASCGRSPSSEAVVPEDPKRMTIRLSSPAFEAGGAVPKGFYRDGQKAPPPKAPAPLPPRAPTPPPLPA